MVDSDDDRDPSHRRRPRYRGTHPRRFDEKYKELAADRYPDEVAKVRSRGQTPAGAHVPVLLAEVVAALAPEPGELALDCTLGHGGHAEAIAARLAPGGRVIGLDRDRDELARTRDRLARVGVPIECIHTNFAGAARALGERGVDAVDLLLADLGVSSMQLDRPERGFSWKRDAPLDLRMDQGRGVPAWQWLADQDADELAALLAEHGDEEHAGEIAVAIVERCRSGNPLRTTCDLTDVVLRAKRLDPGATQADAFDAHPAARAFQAIRIAINQEMEALDQLLRDLPWILRPGGRAALISFHRGEARRIEASFAAAAAAGWFRPELDPPVAPSRAEVVANPRARSARLHVAVRADDA